MLYDSAEEASGQHSHSLTLRRRWFDTVQNYSRRKLTYGKDKLIALSGLAHDYEREGQSRASYKYYKGEERGKYAAGLWEADMPSALLWRTLRHPPPPQRASEYRVPSWSWASVDGYISYDSQMLENYTVSGGIWLSDDPPSPRESSEYDFGAFCVQEIETLTSSSDPMGTVFAGHITLTGLVATAISDEETSSTYTWLRDPDGLMVGALLADVPTEVRPYDKVYCASVRNERDGTLVKMPEELDEVNYGQVGDRFERSETVMGLGLAMIGEEENGKVFRRLGLVRWVRKELFAGKEVSTIKVV